METKYNFYGWESPDVAAIDESFSFVKNQKHLYDLLLKIWCAETCAPRMRSEWKKENPTFGQCSITAFLAQDIFGGQVYGIPLGDGNFHCFNIVGNSVFDLTSEQFGERKLDYDNRVEQTREMHFSKEEKHQRYEYLKSQLLK